jgi:pyridoxine 5'-phosphate synthase PdxJ
MEKRPRYITQEKNLGIVLRVFRQTRSPKPSIIAHSLHDTGTPRDLTLHKRPSNQHILSGSIGGMTIAIVLAGKGRTQFNEKYQH